MKNLLNRIAIAAGVLALCMIVVVNACPMQMFTPAEQAKILMQPTHSEIANLRADLVAGEITAEQCISRLETVKFRLEMQLVLVTAIRDSGRTFSEKVDVLLSIFPWNVRSAGNMPGIIGGAHL